MPNSLKMENFTCDMAEMYFRIRIHQDNKKGIVEETGTHSRCFNSTEVSI